MYFVCVTPHGAYGDQKRIYDHLELELKDSCEPP